jgi:hypothetical protein
MPLFMSGLWHIVIWYIEMECNNHAEFFFRFSCHSLLLAGYRLLTVTRSTSSRNNKIHFLAGRSVRDIKGVYIYIYIESFHIESPSWWRKRKGKKYKLTTNIESYYNIEKRKCDESHYYYYYLKAPQYTESALTKLR